jgi:hypothetical protein
MQSVSVSFLIVLVRVAHVFHRLLSELFCVGGYVLARAVARFVLEQPPDCLPEFLYLGRNVSEERLTMTKADAFWEKTLAMHFQSPVFMSATPSLSAAHQAPGELHDFIGVYYY